MEAEMIHSNCTKLLVAFALLGTVVIQVQAELNTGDTLAFGAGSKVSLEASPGFWVDTPIRADAGVMVGEVQSDSSIDEPFHLFGQQTHHASTAPIAVIDADTGGAMLGFSVWAMVWRGAVVPLGSGGDNEQGEGVARIQCDNGCSKGEAFTLNYSATIPGQSDSIGGLGYRLHAVGTIE